MKKLAERNFMERMAFAAGILPVVLALLCFSACRNDEPAAAKTKLRPLKLPV